MKKYRITIVKEVPSNATPLEILMSRKPRFYYPEILSIDTDNNLVAEIARLANESPTTKEEA